MRFSFLLAILSLTASTYQAQAVEKYGNLLQCPVTDLAAGEGSGQSFLSLIQTTIVPEVNEFTKGYKVASGSHLVETLEYVDKKVRDQVMKSLKGESEKEKLKNLAEIGAQLSGKKVSLYTLPDMIKNTGLSANMYDLSTYIGLASCAGPSLKLADDNYAYNIHYGNGKQKKDNLTGRSFGASRIYNATDSSYSHYLRTLEEYISTTPENVKHFTTTIMETLTNSNPRTYGKVNDNGDSVLTDFFAIWTAEQTRNLMDKRVDLHWDAALFQVTLLSAFHAGQNKLQLFYKDPLSEKVYFTDTTYELAWPKKNHQKQTCEVDLSTRRLKKASLKDYIGVHYKLYEHCGRSGINMSRDEWKLLTREITAYLLNDEEGRQKLEAVREQISGVVDVTKNEFGKTYKENEADILRELARFLINDKTPKEIENWTEIAKSSSDLLEYVRANANDITAVIAKKYKARLVRPR